MENEFELVKSLNELKEQNKKLKAMNNYQKIKIESLENELQKLTNKNKINEIELNEFRAKTGNKNNQNSKEEDYMRAIHHSGHKLEKNDKEVIRLCRKEAIKARHEEFRKADFFKMHEKEPHRADL